MYRRSLSAALVVAAVSALFGAPSAGACGGGPSLESFEVVTEWSKETYRPGAMTSVDITVLRPGEKDPLGFGIELPPTEQTPVEDAYVIAALAVGVPPAWGTGYTDTNGELHLDIKLPRRVRGPINSTTRASIVYNAEGPDCTNVEEWGRKVEAPAFVVKKS